MPMMDVVMLIEEGKLGGHAVQNWCLLRMLPELIGEKITSPGYNQTWQLVLQLTENVSLICAPAISARQFAHLRVLIDEYLHFRKQAFLCQPLKPKHHYVSHLSFVKTPICLNLLILSPSLCYLFFSLISLHVQTPLFFSLLFFNSLSHSFTHDISFSYTLYLLCHSLCVIVCSLECSGWVRRSGLGPFFHYDSGE